MEKVTAGDKELLVRDLYEIRALIQGYVSEGKILYTGFVNERSITEGVKRIANKISKQINAELEAIDKQRFEILKDKELLDDPVDFSVEKMDFKKIENLTLSGNYQFLYDTIFKE
jgi:osmotically-inducible protein OsmY